MSHICLRVKLSIAKDRKQPKRVYNTIYIDINALPIYQKIKKKKNINLKKIWLLK